MATFNKTGSFGADGLWGTAGNWSPSGKPITGNEVILIGTQNDITGADESLVTADIFQVSDGWTRKIGASGAPMRFNATNFFFYSAGGEAWLDGAYTTAYVDTAARGNNALQLNTVNANTIANLHVLRGRVTNGANGTITTLTTSGPRTSQVFVDISSGSTVTTVNHNGGVITEAGTTTTYNQNGGTTTQETGASVTTINLHGGTYQINAGTGTTFNLYGGLLDFTRGTAQKTVTTINYFGGEYRLGEKPSLSGTLTINIHAQGPHGLAPGSTITVT